MGLDEDKMILILGRIECLLETILEEMIKLNLPKCGNCDGTGRNIAGERCIPCEGTGKREVLTG